MSIKIIVVTECYSNTYLVCLLVNNNILISNHPAEDVSNNIVFSFDWLDVKLKIS